MVDDECMEITQRDTYPQGDPYVPALGLGLVSVLEFVC